MDNAPAPSAAPASPPPPPDELPGIGAILTAGTNVTLDNAGLLAGIWAACTLPTQILRIVVGLTGGAVSGEAIKAAVAARDWASLKDVAVVSAIGMVLGLVGYTATLLLAARALRGRPVALGELLADGVMRAFPAFAAAVLIGVCVGFGFVALILPGLYLTVRLCLGVPATAIEELGPLDAVKRSWELVAGRFWDVVLFVLVLIAVGFAAAIALILGGVVLTIVATAAGEAGKAAAQIATGAFQFVLSAWGTACMTKFYLELAERKPLRNRA